MGGDEGMGNVVFHVTLMEISPCLFLAQLGNFEAKEHLRSGLEIVRRMGQIAISALRLPSHAAFPRGTTSRATFSLMCARNSSRF